MSEVLPNPARTDWNRDGRVDAGDEWIELYNAGPDEIDLTDWVLDDQQGASKPFVFPAGATLSASGYMVLYGSITGIDLNNRTGRVRLINPHGRVVDSVTFRLIGPDLSYSRDLSGEWHVDWLPSPGRANVPWPIWSTREHGELPN